MLIEWLAAGAALILLVVLLPRVSMRSKRPRGASGGSGVWIAIGIALSMIFDPKASQAMEIVDREKDLGDQEDGQSGEKP